MNKALLTVCLSVLLSLGGCSRQQSDWEKARTANTTDGYEQFLKKYPSGEFSKQAEARVKELYEERDWQKARDTDTQEAYQAFLKQYPEGKWAEEARIRIENFNLAQPPASAAPSADGAGASKPAGGTPPGAMAPSAAASKPAPPSTAAPSGPPARSSAPPAMKAQTGQKGGGYGVQLGAFKSNADAANRRWARLQSSNGALLAGLSPTVSPKKNGGTTLYRLQIAGLSGKRAHAICKALQAKSQACFVIRPRHAHKRP
jgi:cell division protein FtsN